jgi:diadenosine tetraphosphate (Ap4A) HIT family hydrolase
MADLSVADCLFCDATASRILCENPGWFARYDNYPSTPGHVEIVPKRHVESFDDLTAAEAVAAYALLREARRRLAAEYAPDAWTIGINDGPAAGRTIHHLHIHLIPRRWGDVPDPRGGIRRGLPNGDPDKWVTAKETNHA